MLCARGVMAIAILTSKPMWWHALACTGCAFHQSAMIREEVMGAQSKLQNFWLLVNSEGGPTLTSLHIHNRLTGFHWIV